MIAATVFAASAVFIAWVVAGYPLGLRWRALSRPRPFHRDETVRSVSVVMAVRNGEKFLRRKLESILEQDYPSESIEIIVISDGSTDSTEAIAADCTSLVGWGSAPGIRIDCSV